MANQYLYIENITKKTLGDMKNALPNRVTWTFKDGKSQGTPVINPKAGFNVVIVVRGHGGSKGTIENVDACQWLNKNVLTPLSGKNLPIIRVIFLVCYAGKSLQSATASLYLPAHAVAWGPLDKLCDGGPGEMWVNTYSTKFETKKAVDNPGQYLTSANGFEKLQCK
jgi:hypothetical protein